MKILFLSRWYPQPADNGAKLRVLNLIKQLSARHEVSLASFASEAPNLDAMRPWCANVLTARYRAFRPGNARALAGFLSPVPRSFIDTHSTEFAHLAQEEAQRFEPDVVIASQVDMAPYAAALKVNDTCKRIFEEVEVSLLRDAAQNGNLHARLTWAKSRRYLGQLLHAFDGCTVASPQEQTHVAGLIAKDMPLAVIPNGVDVEACARVQAMPQPDTLIYNGALTYHANFDAVDYFVRDILPLIQTSHPHVKLYVTGSLEGVPLDRLPHNDGVVFTGYLDDVKQRVAESWVTIAPLRVGGGTRLKILESLALGTPVVATTKGAEGLSLRPNHDVLLADSPAEFAAHVVRVLESLRIRADLSAHGRMAVGANYDWHQIGRRLNEFVDGIAGTQTSVDTERVTAQTI